MVAQVVATRDAKLAICKERSEASLTCSLFQAARYQRQEKPSQMAIERPSLKEKTTRVMIWA